MLTDTQRAFLNKVGIYASDADPDMPDSAGIAARLEKLEQILRHARSLPPAGAALVQSRVSVLEHATSQARAEMSAGDARGAERRIAREADTARALAREIAEVTRYLAEARKFQTRLAETRAHLKTGGAIAIKDYLGRLEADERRRAEAESRGDVGQALTACEAQDHRHDAMMAEAARGIECTRLEAEIDAEIARLEAQSPGGRLVLTVVEDIRGMMSDALNFTKSDNWVAAVLMLRKARIELALRLRGLELEQLMTADGGDADAALAGLRSAIDRLRKLPGARRFGAELRACADRLKQAHAAIPDRSAAGDLLAEAQRMTTSLADTMIQGDRCAGAVRGVADEAKSLGRLNSDGCASPELKRAALQLRAAEAFAHDRKFSEALAALDAASQDVQSGLDVVRLYTGLVAPARRALSGKAGQNGDEQQEQALARLDAAFGARDLAGSAALAREVLALPG